MIEAVGVNGACSAIVLRTAPDDGSTSRIRLGFVVSSQSEPPPYAIPVATAPETCSVLARPVPASIRVTASPRNPNAQTAPSPTTSPPGRVPAAIVAVIAPVAGSMRVIVPPASEALHTEPPAAVAESRNPAPLAEATPTFVVPTTTPVAPTRASAPVEVTGTQTSEPSTAGTPAP